MNNWITFYEDGNTSLSPDEQDGLIPPLTTHQELNVWEHENILEARKWIVSNKYNKNNIFTENFIKALHGKMFNKTWKWAGKYRLSDKNIGIHFYKIPIEMKTFIDDITYWLRYETFLLDELAVRIHHKLVYIHPFPNGNGRHARLFADIIMIKNSLNPFTWGKSNLQQISETRKQYISALKQANNGSFQDLINFAKS